MTTDDTTSDDSTGDTGASDEPTHTQAEVDKIVQRRLGEQKRKLEAEAQAAADKAKAEAERAAMDEADRIKAEAADAKAEADKARAEAAAERLTAKVERKLLAAGVPDSALARAVHLVQVDVDATDDDIAAEIEAVRADVPALFEPAKTDDGAKPPAGGTPPPPPKGGQGQPTKNEQARELLRARGLTPRSEAA